MCLCDYTRFLRNDKMKQSSNFIRSFCRSAIEAKRANASVEEEDGRRDILNVAMDAGVFSDEELIDQMMTFLAAGEIQSLSPDPPFYAYFPL